MMRVEMADPPWRGRELYCFSKKNDGDFLVKDNLYITEAIQVAFGLNTENVNREIGGLADTMKIYNIPKVTLIVFDDTKYPG
jgi:uncharacterized protein